MLATSIFWGSILKTDNVLSVTSMSTKGTSGVKVLVDSWFASTLSWILILSMSLSGVESI